MELASSLQQLGGYLPRKSQKSQDVIDRTLPLLKSGAYAKQGDEAWETLEKLTLAALDQGNIEVADECLKLIADRFPDSPRVDCLTGIRMEATESLDTCLEYYDELLRADSSNPAIWRRKASVLRRQGKIDQSVRELYTLLDTFYTEVDGWLELADIYISCQQYTYALQSLSHALLLSPQNPFYFLQFAETAYLATDIPLSLKMYLQVVDMTDDDDEDLPPSDSIPTGITLRAWFGVKLCTHRLISEPRLAASSASETTAPTSGNLSALDELATERLRTAYLNTTGESPPKADKTFIDAMAKVIQ
ncbi:TPR-like protein [Panus rudis PR-1116 ss-1]|nr:TPR-like protein [Panus rudis PR-1116 ss-1]